MGLRPYTPLQNTKMSITEEYKINWELNITTMKIYKIGAIV